MHAEFATDYFELRGLDAQKTLLDSTSSRIKSARADPEPLIRAGWPPPWKSLKRRRILETTRAEATDVDVTRAAFQHAIAALIGKPASVFNCSRCRSQRPPPINSLGIAVRFARAAAGYFRGGTPRGGSKRANRRGQGRLFSANYSERVRGRFESAVLHHADSGAERAMCSLGAAGPNDLRRWKAQRNIKNRPERPTTRSVGGLSATTVPPRFKMRRTTWRRCAFWRGIHYPGRAVGRRATFAGSPTTRYRGGVTNYLEVTTAQSAALSDEVTAVDLLTRRMAASVLLMKALGGGWNISQIPHI